MKDRLRDIRLQAGLSQTAFGQRIGIKSRAHISALESGTKKITDRIITDICREFKINEIWFRTGEGKMSCANEDPDEEKALIIDDILYAKDPLKLALYKEIKNMNKAQLDSLREVIRSLAKSVK